MTKKPAKVHSSTAVGKVLLTLSRRSEMLGASRRLLLLVATLSLLGMGAREVDGEVFLNWFLTAEENNRVFGEYPSGYLLILPLPCDLTVLQL